MGILSPLFSGGGDSTDGSSGGFWGGGAPGPHGGTAPDDSDGQTRGSGGSGGLGPNRPNRGGGSNTTDISLSDLGIAWVTDLKVLQGFAGRVDRLGLTGAIIGIVATFVVNMFIDVWAGVLGALGFAAGAVASVPDLVILGPADAAAAPIASFIGGLWVDYGTWAMSTASGYGPAAPFVAIALFTPAVAMTGFTIQLVIGLLDWFLPISELPILGWIT